MTSLLAIVVLAAGFVPPGWTAMFDATGRCAYAVPGDWKVEGTVDASAPFAASPDGRIRATLIWSVLSQSRYSSDLRGLSHPKVVHEDTADRFWIELASPPPLGGLHIAIIASPVGACTVEIVATGRGDAANTVVISTIVHTLTSVQ
jgi:hypothetical protein